MKRIVSIITLLCVTSVLQAQTSFEGIIKWNMIIISPEVDNSNSELSPEQRAEFKDGITQLEKQLKNPKVQNNPSIKQQLELQLQAMKYMVAAGKSDLIPTGFTIKLKNNNSLTNIDGGLMNVMEDLLYIKSTDKTYSIRKADKTYSVVSSSINTSIEEPVITVTPTSETKKILAYTCTKYIVTTTHHSVAYIIYIWATNDITQFGPESFHSGGLNKDLTSGPFKKIAGVPMRIEMSEKNQTVTMEIIEMTPIQLADSILCFLQDTQKFLMINNSNKYLVLTKNQTCSGFFIY